MDGDEPVGTHEHGLFLPLDTALAVMGLQAKDPIGLGQHVKILLSPDVRPVVGLGLAGEIAVEPNMGEMRIPKPDDPLGRPDIRPHVHSHPEHGQAILDGVAEFPFDQFAHHFAVELQFV